LTIRIKNCRIIATRITVTVIAINIKIGKMKFYNRESEIKQLKEISRKSQLNAQLTFVTGRRRVGKTRLLKMAFQDEVFLYFF
jgi:predicted AAA+ superfamily ATPase